MLSVGGRVNELRFFWNVVSEARKALAAGDVRKTQECREDLDTILIRTSNPQLRERAAAFLAELQSSEEAAACASSV